NFTSIYPVLKLLHSGVSPQDWIDRSIATNQEEIDRFEKELDQLTTKQLCVDRDNAREQADVAARIAKVESKKEQAVRMQARYQLARKYISLLPNDAFRTLVVVIAF